VGEEHNSDIWKGKAKVKWNFEGDMNTIFFHKTKKSNGPTKLITSIIDGNDVIIDLAAIFDHVLHNPTYVVATIFLLTMVLSKMSFLTSSIKTSTRFSPCSLAMVKFLMSSIRLTRIMLLPPMDLEHFS